MSTQAIAVYTGSCTGHGTGLGSIHHPGFGGGTLSNCPHSATDPNIVPKTVDEMDATTWWEPTPQLPDSGTQLSTIVINGKIPIVMDDLFSRIIEVGKTGVGILMVEQNAKQALGIADRGYVLVNGENRIEGKGADLLNNPDVRKSFLGG